MKDTVIKLSDGQIIMSDITKEYVIPGWLGEYDNAIRIYRSGSESVTLQLRNLSSITYKGGKVHRTITTATDLDADILDELIESLQEAKKDISLYKYHA